jgi:hypothetical protein
MNHYSNEGPWNLTLNDQLDNISKQNVAFSQMSWEDSKQDGCLPPPNFDLPKWPPKPNNGFIYPDLDKNNNHIIGNVYEGQYAAPNVPGTISNLYRYNNNNNNINLNQTLSNNNDNNISLYHKLHPSVILPCIKNTINGIKYDLDNLNQIKNKDGNKLTHFQKIIHIFCRDDRLLYLSILISGIILVILFINEFTK